MLVPGQCAQRHGGDGIGLSLCFKVIFEIGRIFFYKTHVIFDLLDILTLQERLEIGWGKPLLRSSVNTIKYRHATSPKKASCVFDLLALADYFSTRMMSGQSERTRENSWIR